MEDLKVKIKDLEDRIDTVEARDIPAKSLKEMLTLLGIIESLALFHQSPESMEKINKLKERIQSKSNAKIYQSADKNTRIKGIKKAVEAVLQMNQFIYSAVQEQGDAVESMEILNETALMSIENANEHLLSYQQFLERKNGFIRKILMLMGVFTLLLIIRIVI